MGYDLQKEQERLNDVKLILKDLLKVVKIVAMYPEGNPLPESLKRSFSERLVALVESYEDVKISIGRETISLGDETVYTDGSKEECLAGLFFDPGITSITFKAGLTIEEIYRFLNVLKAYNNSNRKTDLVAQIWEAGLSAIALTTVEDIALAGYEGDFRVAEMFDAANRGNSTDIQLGSDQHEKYDSIFCALDNAPSTNTDDSDSGEIRTADSQRLRRPGEIFYAVTPEREGEIGLEASKRDDVALHAAEAAEAMGFGDLAAAGTRTGAPPNTALILNDEFKLSEEEEQQIGAILVEDAQFDPFESTVSLLKEMLLQEVELPEFSETVGTCEKVINEFVRNGRLTEAGQILGHFQSLQDQLKSQQPQWAERLKDARVMAGSRNRLTGLSESLNQNADISAVELRRYLELFDWEVLEGLVDMLGLLTHEPHRRALCDHLVTHGQAHLPIIGKGVFDKRWYVVRNSVQILSRIDDDRAVTYLEKAAENPEKRVRMEAIKALKNAVSSRALGVLRRAALDADSEVRKLALEMLLAQPGRAAFEAVASIVSSDAIGAWDNSERQKLLNTYSMLGSEDAVAYLQSLIDRRNLWHDTTLAFYREAAFEALAHNRSAEAERLLVRLGHAWTPGLKSQAQAALKRRREIMFGGERELHR